MWVSHILGGDPFWRGFKRKLIERKPTILGCCAFPNLRQTPRTNNHKYQIERQCTAEHLHLQNIPRIYKLVWQHPLYQWISSIPPEPVDSSMGTMGSTLLRQEHTIRRPQHQVPARPQHQVPVEVKGPPWALPYNSYSTYLGVRFAKLLSW